MRLKISAIALIASQLLLWGCYVQGPEYTEELDIVGTNYDNTYDFVGKGTYTMPPEVVKITGDPTAPPEYVRPIYSGPILAQIDQNMTAMGWTKVDKNAIPPPDIQVLPAAWTTTTVFTGGYYGGYYCWYYPYYCGGGWYYPYTYTTSYTSGTLLLTIADANGETIDDSKRVVWSAAANGVLSGTADITRVLNGIDQMFTQSPYLKTN